MAANSQELKYVFFCGENSYCYWRIFAHWTRKPVFFLWGGGGSPWVNAFPFFTRCPHTKHDFYVLHKKCVGIDIFPFCCWKKKKEKKEKSTWSHASLHLQVPDTWLRRIRTRDWELRFTQKVAEKNHRNRAWNTFVVRCMTFRQMVKVSLYAANMLRFSKIFLFLLISLAADFLQRLDVYLYRFIRLDFRPRSGLEPFSFFIYFFTSK